MMKNEFSLKATKTFLSTLNANDNLSKSSLLFDQFFESKKLNWTSQEVKDLNQMIDDTRTLHRWNESYPFGSLASQNCSEMLMLVGM